jgi:hypothetical protein
MTTRLVRTSVCPHCNNRHDIQEHDGRAFRFVHHLRRRFSGLSNCPGSNTPISSTLIDIEYEVERVQDEW